MADIRRTGLLDDFRRTENPLSYGGRWNTLNYDYGTVLKSEWDGFSHYGSVEVHAVTGGTAQSSYWGASRFYGDVECWSFASGSFDLREGMRIYLHVSNPYGETGRSIATGYRGLWDINSGTVRIDRLDADAVSLLASVSGSFGADTRGILLRRTGDLLELWKADVTGFSPSSWSRLVSASDSTYDGGYLGLGTAQDDPNPGWLGFGGGSLNRSQIYRYVSN